MYHATKEQFFKQEVDPQRSIILKLKMNVKNWYKRDAKEDLLD